MNEIMDRDIIKSELVDIIVRVDGEEELKYFTDEKFESIIDMVIEHSDKYRANLHLALIDWWMDQPWK